MTTVKHFSHTDLDGVGSGLLVRAAYGADNVETFYCDYHNINERVQKYLDNITEGRKEPHDIVYITDISVNEDLANQIQDMIVDGHLKTVYLIDHHDTAKWLNAYDWAIVDPIHSNVPLHKSSGTSLLVDHFDQLGEVDLSYGYRHFAEVVRKYDTWEWTTHYNEVLPKELNDYLYMVGRKEFVDLMEATIPTNTEGHEVYFDVKARALLDQKQLEIADYIAKKQKQLTVIEGTTYNVGLVFAELFTSELGNELAKANPELDFIMMIDMGSQKISFRGIKDDIHLGEIAGKLGGGGHPKAAGAQFTDLEVIKFTSQFDSIW